MTPDRALSEPERLVRDALTVAYNAGAEHEVRIYEIDDHARDLVAALRPLLAAEPEIVTGKQARELPVGSIVVRCCDRDDRVPAGSFPITQTSEGFRWDRADDCPGPLNRLYRFRVLYRAPAPAPKVGDVVRTEADLDRLPERSVIRADGNNVAHRTRHGWAIAGGGTLDALSAAWLPARVLDLGADS